MSTVIANGYRLAPGVDFWEFLDVVRSTMNPIRDHLDAHALIEGAVTIIDRAALAGEPGPAKPLACSLRDYNNERQTHPTYSIWSDPHAFSVSATYDTVDDRFYLLRYSFRTEYEESFDQLPGVQEYGYWNSGDNYPPGVTEADWQERKLVWKRILPTGRPLDSTVQMVLRPTQDYRLNLMLDPNSDAHQVVRHVWENQADIWSADHRTTRHILSQVGGHVFMANSRLFTPANDIINLPGYQDTWEAFRPAFRDLDLVDHIVGSFATSDDPPTHALTDANGLLAEVVRHAVTASDR